MKTRYALLLCCLLVSASQARWQNSLGMDFLSLPEGSFTMGTPDLTALAFEWPSGDLNSLSDETPAHKVTLTGKRWLQRTEVTQGQWLDLMGTRPGPASHWQRKDWRELPVVGVTWFRANAFVKALNKADGRHRYRLPTEAEYEYASRAGSTGLRPFPREELPEYGWYRENSGDVPHPVATRKANAWGFHDLLGNAWEWVADNYAPNTYQRGPVTNPAGPATSPRRVRRGGSYHCPPHLLRPGYRAADFPSKAYSVLGFRVLAEPR